VRVSEAQKTLRSVVSQNLIARVEAGKDNILPEELFPPHNLPRAQTGGAFRKTVPVDAARYR
jgi:hypothetical protein